jgi:hypothetical protein
MNLQFVSIPVGSTSQSVEVYIGSTGLTPSTSGLVCYYSRTRSSAVQINLVSRNISQAWTEGGFVEVNSTTMPGLYRLDIPDAAFLSGADDVSVMIKTGVGTDGVMLSVKLSASVPTTSSITSAVWSENLSSYNTNNTAGRILKNTTALNPDITGSASNNITATTTTFSVDRNDTTGTFDNQTIVFTSGQLNGVSKAIVSWTKVGSYAIVVVDSPLVVPPTNNTPFYILPQHVHSIAEISQGVVDAMPDTLSTRVFVGRFDLRQTGSDDVDTIEVFTTDTPSFELQLTDGDGNEVPVTGATLGLRILDVASTVVETGTPTVEYGTGGIVRWTGPGTYLAIGCPVGMYRLFIDRTVSGTTTTFGPLQIKVQTQ